MVHTRVETKPVVREHIQADEQRAEWIWNRKFSSAPFEKRDPMAWVAKESVTDERPPIVEDKSKRKRRQVRDRNEDQDTGTNRPRRDLVISVEMRGASRHP